MRKKESSLFRTLEKVEYLVHGDRPDWTHAFLSLTINKRTAKFFCHTHYIINGTCELNGKVYA